MVDDFVGYLHDEDELSVVVLIGFNCFGRNTNPKVATKNARCETIK